MRKLIRHFTHSHALELFESVKKDEDHEDEDIEPIICSGCEQELSSSNEPAFTCPKGDCEFYLHKSCYELPRALDHKSHPDHKLSLLSEPPECSLYYDCNACGEVIKGFSFHCEKSCDFKLHVKCAFLPDTVGCKVHDHLALAVRHCTPRAGESLFDTVLCDVCDGNVIGEYWSYYCEECDFVTHLQCAFATETARPPVEEEDEEEEVEVREDEEEEVEVKEEDGEEVEEEEDEEGLSDEMKLHLANIKAMNRMAILKFQMQMSEMNARAAANLFRF